MNFYLLLNTKEDILKNFGNKQLMDHIDFYSRKKILWKSMGSIKGLVPILLSLHWLPIKFYFNYKVLLLTYKALNGLAPVHLTNLLSPYNPSRSLRSQNSGLF